MKNKKIHAAISISFSVEAANTAFKAVVICRPRLLK
jgi:hypothetical protein